MANKHMANKNLFIYKLMNNPNAKILVSGLSKDIVAYTTQDFQFRTQASWSGRSSSSFLNKINALERIGKEAYNRFFGSGASELVSGMILDIVGSMLDYQGTELFGFSLPMYFVATQSTDDVRTKIGYLAEGQFPTFGKGEGGFKRVYAPNNYRITEKANIEGAVSIRIGRWFRTNRIFIIDSMDFSVSKETIPSGLPLYASGSVAFKSTKILSIDQVKGMFLID